MKNHLSDCAVHNMPAFPNGPCDCGEEKLQEQESLRISCMGPVVIEPVHPDFEKVYYEGNTGNKWHNVVLTDQSINCLPRYSSEGDSGFDVRAMEDFILAPGDSRLIKLGFKMTIPEHTWHEQGYRYECQVRPRSGISMKTYLRMNNAPGTIDNLYTSEVGILLTNENYAINGSLMDISGKLTEPPKWHLHNIEDGSYLISKGDRIAQLVFNEVIRPIGFFLGKVDAKREGGFGSTGVK